MSRSLGDRLPPELLARLDASDPSRFAGRAIPLCTVDEAGCPHVALLSTGEVVAHGPSRLHVALYEGSRASAHLRRTARCTLLLFDAGIAAYVKAEAVERERSMAAVPGNSRFELRVLDVLVDSTDEDREATAVITSGITFRLPPGHDAAHAVLVAALRNPVTGEARA